MTSILTFHDPSLVILVGPSGSGKSTFCRRHFKPTQSVATDRCRELLTDTEDFSESGSAAAFALFHQLISQRINAGFLTVADSTGLLRIARHPLLQFAHEAGVPAFAVVFHWELDECIQRDQSRPRRVGPNVLRRQFREFSAARLALPFEGFERTYHIDPHMQDRLEVRIENRTPIFMPAAVRNVVIPPVATKLPGTTAERLEVSLGISLDTLAEPPSRSCSAVWDLLPPLFTTAKLGVGADAKSVTKHLTSLTEPVVFRSVPAGTRGVALFAQDAVSAKRVLDAEPHALAALSCEDGTGAEDHGLVEKLESLRNEMRNCGIWRRKEAVLFALDVQIAVREDGRREIVPIGPAFPAPRTQPEHPDYFWEWLEVDAHALDLTPASTNHHAPGMTKVTEVADWLLAQHASGRTVFEIRRNAADIPHDMFGEDDGAEGISLSSLRACRAEATACIQSVDAEGARLATRAAWSLAAPGVAAKRLTG